MPVMQSVGCVNTVVRTNGSPVVVAVFLVVDEDDEDEDEDEDDDDDDALEAANDDRDDDVLDDTAVDVGLGNVCPGPRRVSDTS